MGQSELDTLISAFTAPMPNQKVIITDYEAKERKKKSNKNHKGKINSERSHEVKLES
jgi:hypothetical protein